MATHIRCDNCGKEIPKSFWRGKTHVVRVEGGEEYEYDICRKCEEDITKKFLGVVNRFFKLEKATAWKVKGDSDTKIWD